MTIKEIMKNVEKQNVLRKELKQDELEVKFSENCSTVDTIFFNRTFTTYKALMKALEKVYIEQCTEELLNADFEYDDGSFEYMEYTIIVK